MADHPNLAQLFGDDGGGGGGGGTSGGLAGLFGDTGSGDEVVIPGKRKKKGGGGLFGRVLHDVYHYSPIEPAANLTTGLASSLVHIPSGVYALEEATRQSLGQTIRHPWVSGTNDPNYADNAPKMQALTQGLKQHYADYYGHDFLGHLYNHPADFALDALTAFDLGAGAAAKAGKLGNVAKLSKLGERGELVTRSPKAIHQGEGPVQTTYTSVKPSVKIRQQIIHGLREASVEQKRAGGVLGKGGEMKQYGKGIQQEATQTALGRLGPLHSYEKVVRKLRPDEWTALHIRAMDVHPDDLAVIWEGLPNGAALTKNVRELVLNPSKRMEVAEPAMRAISSYGAQLFEDNNILTGETIDARAGLTKQQASEELGRPAREITGDPYYFPHATEPARGASPLKAGGGGKAQPQRPGTTKQNLGKLFLAGKLHLRGDVLGPELLRRVKFLKYKEINNALIRGAVKLTRDQIDEHPGGKLPKGWEYIRSGIPVLDEEGKLIGTKAQTIPPTLRGEGEAGPLFTGEPTGTRPYLPGQMQRDLTKLEREHNAALDQIAHGLFGPTDMNEVRFRNAENARARRQARGVTRAGKLSGASGTKSTLRPKVLDERRALAEKAVEDAIAANPSLTETNPSMRAWRTRTDRIDRLREAVQPDLQKLIPNPEDLQDSVLAEHGFTTKDIGQALRNEQGHYHIVPTATARAATGEFTRASTPLYYFNKYPMKFWRALILGTRPAFLVNNLVGNSLMYAMKTGGTGAIRDLFMSMMETHGREFGLQLLRDPALPNEVRQSLYHEFFPEHGARGTFGYTQAPGAEGFLPSAGGKLARGAKAVTSAIPKATAVVAEENLRHALIRNFMRRSPEFKAMWKSMPKESRDFETTARQLLTGERGAQYQHLVSQQVDRALGNYTHLNPVERNVLRTAAPFYAWYRAIFKTTLHLALDNPLRAQFLYKLGQMGQGYENELFPGGLPSWLQGIIPLGAGPRRGTVTALTTAGINPWATIAQLQRGGGTDISSLGLNPFIQGALDEYANKSQHGQTPSIWQVGGGALAGIVTGLPTWQLAFPRGPSPLYPYRGRRTAIEAWAGLPRRTFDIRVAAEQAKKGR